MRKEDGSKLDILLEDVYEDIEKKKIYEGRRYIPISISAETVDGDSATTPIVRYILSRE